MTFKVKFRPILETLIFGIFIAVSSDRSTLAAAYGEPPLRYPIIKINQTIPIFKLNSFVSSPTASSSTASTTSTILSTTTKRTKMIISKSKTKVLVFVCNDTDSWSCGNICIPIWQFCPLTGSCHPSLPIICNEDGRCRSKLENCSNSNSSKQADPFASLSLSLSTKSPTSSAFVSCRENEWLCGDHCIHRREFCDLTGSCHSTFPIPCGDGQRCFRRQDNCWTAACLNHDCSKEAKPAAPGSGPISELDRMQAKFLRYCPDARHRLDVCPDRQYTERSFCFYEYEWPCGGRCIPKSEVCDQTDRGGCDAGMKRCGKDRCVARNTPCNGKCWSETALNICGTNMCLSKYQLEDYHVCDGICYDHTIPCNGSCQNSDFFLCASGNQCYRYWDYCDHEQHCDDASDEGTICRARDYIVFVVPTLMLLVIGGLVFSLVFVRIRSCAHVRAEARREAEFEEDEGDEGQHSDHECFVDLPMGTPTSATATIIMTTVPSLNGNSLTRTNGQPNNNNYELDTPV